MMEKFDPDDEASFDRMRDFFGPAQVDQSVRQALHFCWMSLPKNRRNPDGLEREFRPIVDRAIRDFREDSSAFGLGG